MLRAEPAIRIGHGYDLHRLDALAPAGQGRPFVLGGVRFDHDHGPVAHSDGDVLLHAITDAILGALSKPDIGQAFPDSDPRWQGADSATFIAAATAMMRGAGYEIGNLDATVICETPKIGPRKAAIVANVSKLLGCGESRINVKGKTHEAVDAVGEGRAIEAHVVVILAADQGRNSP